MIQHRIINDNGDTLIFCKSVFSIAAVCFIQTTFVYNHKPMSQANHLKHNLAPNVKTLLRPLYINFDHYTDGDLVYKKELGGLIIDNLREFQRSVPDSLLNDKKESFLKACHKMKVTLDMLEDKEFNKLVDGLQHMVSLGCHDDRFVALSTQLQKICDLVVASLKRELSFQDV